MTACVTTADNQFLIGLDVYDCVLVINSQAALDSFSTHKATLGAEIGVAAGPYGAGAAVEAGLEKAPVFSYVRSRGLYAGVELVGQVFVERFDENAAMYHWPGVKAGDIVSLVDLCGEGDCRRRVKLTTAVWKGTSADRSGRAACCSARRRDWESST